MLQYLEKFQYILWIILFNKEKTLLKIIDFENVCLDNDVCKIRSKPLSKQMLTMVTYAYAYVYWGLNSTQ